MDDEQDPFNGNAPPTSFQLLQCQCRNASSLQVGMVINTKLQCKLVHKTNHNLFSVKIYHYQEYSREKGRNKCSTTNNKQPPFKVNMGAQTP